MQIRRIRAGTVFALVAVAFVMLACTKPSGHGYAPPPDPGPGEALVNVYRPGGWGAGGDTVTIYVDDQRVGSMPTGAYVTIPLSPGPHVIALKRDVLFGLGETTSARLELDAAADSGYYVRLNSDLYHVDPMSGAIAYTYGLELVPNEVGEADLKEL